MTRDAARGRPTRSSGPRCARAAVTAVCAATLAVTAVTVPATAQPDDGAGEVTGQLLAEPPLQRPAAPLLTDLPPSWPSAPEQRAAAWVLVEAANGQVLAGEDERDARAVASTIKVLTALTVARRTEPDEVVTVGEEVTDTVGANIELEPGDELTVEQLLVGMLVRSGNDAAEALAAHVAGDLDDFLALMRDDAAALGLATTGADAVRLESVSGLGDRNRLSAHDLAVIARAALADPELRPLLAAEEATLPRVGSDENRNLLIGSYPGATGVKTGFTAEAGNGLIGSAQRDDRELIVVVLDAGDDPARFEAAAQLLDHGFDTFAPTEIAEERRLLVAGGHRTLEVAAPPVTVPVDAELRVALPLPTRADGRTGPVATLQLDDTAVATLPTALVGEPPPPVDGAARIGRGAVDGVHAALRATLAADDQGAAVQDAAAAG